MSDATQTKTADQLAADKAAADAAAAAKPKPAAKPAAPAKPDTRFVPASESCFFTSTEFVYPTVAVKPPVGTPMEHLLRPDYWANVRGRFKEFSAGTIVRAMPVDNAWWAELLVEQAGQGYARVKLLRHVELDAAARAPLVPPGYDIHPVGTGKYRAVRLDGGVVLKDTCTTVEEALKVVRDDIAVLRS